MPLTDAKLIKLQATHERALRANPKPRKATDSDNLYVLLQPSGSMLWRLAYRFDDKQKVLALGRYPHVSLTKARKAADDAREVLAEGRDPSVERKEAHGEAVTAPTGRAACQSAAVAAQSSAMSVRH